MTTLETVLIVCLVIAVALLLRLNWLLMEWKRYAKRQKARADRAEFLSSLMAWPTGFFLLKAYREIRDYLR